MNCQIPCTGDTSGRAPRITWPIFLGLFLLFQLSAQASWYVDNSRASSRIGGPSRYGPFATYAAAKAFCDANNVGMTVISGGSDDVSQSQPTVDNSEAERQREAEEKAAAEKKAAEEQAARDKAAREAEELRRFQKIRDDATKQLKGFNQATGQTLKGVSGGGVSGLKEAPRPTAATVNTDAMVVDFRNLSSGLPKSVDDAIPHTPAGNRIRKGFQAIAKHDWDNALLWFKDAYNREPGDPGLHSPCR